MIKQKNEQVIDVREGINKSCISSTKTMLKTFCLVI